MDLTRQRPTAFNVCGKETKGKFMESILAHNPYWEYTKRFPEQIEEGTR
jgi:hypothetical protein